MPAWQPDCEKMEREWENWEEMEREWGNGERFTLYISSFSLYFLPLSISYIKDCLILSQNAKYGTFIANVTNNLTYALWENNSGSNSLRESSASCEGLSSTFFELMNLMIYGRITEEIQARRHPKSMPKSSPSESNIFWDTLYNCIWTIDLKLMFEY